MALDKHARKSTACHWCPWFPPSVGATNIEIPLTQRDRQATAWTYSGVLTQDVDTDEEIPTATQRIDRERDRRFTEFYPSPKGVFDI